MDPSRVVEVLRTLIADGIEGPWREYSSGFNDYWATAGILKSKPEADGRVVLEVFESHDRSDLVIRVYQEEPLEVFFAKLTGTPEGLHKILQQARAVFEAQPGEAAVDDFQGIDEMQMPEEAKDSPELQEKWAEIMAAMAQLEDSGIREALNPIPPPFRFEDLADEDGKTVVPQ